MPPVFIFDKRYPFALSGSRQDDRGPTLYLLRFLEGLQDLLEFVSVYDDRMPTKATEFFLISFTAGSIHCFLALSQTVNINDVDQII